MAGDYGESGSLAEPDLSTGLSCLRASLIEGPTYLVYIVAPCGTAFGKNPSSSSGLALPSTSARPCTVTDTSHDVLFFTVTITRA